MKDYRIEIGFAYTELADKWFSEKDKKAIRDKVADLVYETLKKEMDEKQAFSEIDNIDKSLIKGDMTIYMG